MPVKNLEWKRRRSIQSRSAGNTVPLKDACVDSFRPPGIPYYDKDFVKNSEDSGYSMEDVEREGENLSPRQHC